MPITHTPLRYPGGKTSIYKMMKRLLKHNNLLGGHYYEPYAGGCGLAISLLIKGDVSCIHINDIDRSIWSFWHAVLNHTEELIGLIEETDISIPEWYRQRVIQDNKASANILELAFSTLFMNRTNRSGIISKAGMIGGTSQQSKYKIDCRFNKVDLIRKIRKIASMKSCINLYNMDAHDFIETINSHSNWNGLVFIDPPYFEKGSTLYTNFYDKNQHSELSCKIKSITKPWVMTYDNAEEIKILYQDLSVHEFNLNYSAAVKRVGTELIIFSDKLTYDDKFMFDFSISP